jgi:D-alanyl-D-alanine dipeptidase
VWLGDGGLPRRDVGAEVEARIHAAVHADPDKVRKAALAATPPTEPTPRRASDLVPLTGLDPTIKVDTIYATTRNFMGIPIYEKAGAYMQRPAAEAVARASKALHRYGYGLWVTDAYRPWYATKMFWDATPPEDHNFVADPALGSRHNRGCAVDLTLYDLKTGKPVEMTGRIDEMSARSIANYDGGTTRQRWLRALLRREMEAQGFTVYTDEWWHFDYKDWPDYAIGTATYTDLDAGRAH